MLKLSIALTAYNWFQGAYSLIAENKDKSHKCELQKCSRIAFDYDGRRPSNHQK